MENQNHPSIPQSELVEIADEQERNYWAAKLGVSCGTLKSAVRAIHSMVFSRLKEYLSIKKVTSSSSF